MNPEFLINLSLVLAHSVVYEKNDVPEGIDNNFINGVGFGLDVLSSLVSGKPTIPQFTPTNLGDEQAKAIQANITALPQDENLANQTNQFNINQIQSMLRQVIPGYDSLVNGASKSIEDELSGKIPADVAASLQTATAGRNIESGTSGTGFGANLTARSLGLTSLDLVNKGLSSAQAWLQTMNGINAPGMFNLSSMFITPTQQAAVTTANNTGQFQRDYVSNMNDWQHSIGYAAGQDIQDTGATVMSLLSSFMGGMGGMGGGGKPSSGSSGGSFSDPNGFGGALTMGM